MCLFGYEEVELDEPPPKKEEKKKEPQKGDHVLVSSGLHVQPIAYPQAMYYPPGHCHQYYQSVPAVPSFVNFGGGPGPAQGLQLVPEVANANTTYWCKESSDGAFTQRTVNDIMANFQPGHWERTGSMPHWVQD